MHCRGESRSAILIASSINLKREMNGLLFGNNALKIMWPKYLQRDYGMIERLSGLIKYYQKNLYNANQNLP